MQLGTCTELCQHCQSWLLLLSLSQYQDNVITAELQHHGMCCCYLAGEQTNTSGTRWTEHGLLLACFSQPIAISDSSLLESKRFVRNLACMVLWSQSIHALLKQTSEAFKVLSLLYPAVTFHAPCSSLINSFSPTFHISLNKTKSPEVIKRTQADTKIIEAPFP